MLWMPERSNEPEWMDAGREYVSPEEYTNALLKLDQVGCYLGGDRVIWKELSQLGNSPRSVLDVGCGGGFLAARLAQRYPNCQVLGIDLDEEAIRYARAKHAPLPRNLRFEWRQQTELLEPDSSYDVVMSSLVCHHISDEHLPRFIQDAVRVAQVRVILNDLHRHFLAYAVFRMFAPLAFRSRMITHDGLISIKRSFRRSDWKRVLEAANLGSDLCRIKRYFPYRWGVSIRCQT